MPFYDEHDDIKDLGPAARYQSKYYPLTWNGKVPLLIRMTRTVHSDLWMIDEFPLVARAGQEYRAYTNSHGAISAWVDGQQLGVKPDEFEVTQWAIVTNVQRQPG